jgi:hypothetical protein
MEVRTFKIAIKYSTNNDCEDSLTITIVQWDCCEVFVTIYSVSSRGYSLDRAKATVNFQGIKFEEWEPTVPGYLEKAKMRLDVRLLDGRIRMSLPWRYLPTPRFELPLIFPNSPFALVSGWETMVRSL